MAAFVKVHYFVSALATGTVNLLDDTLKVALTNTAPVPATSSVWSAGAFPPPASANGYSSGGNTVVQEEPVEVPGVYKLQLPDTVFTATAGGIGPFRYAILYDVTSGNKIVGYYDYGSEHTVVDGATFTIDFSAADGVLTIE